jgi:hypothetical protein
MSNVRVLINGKEASILEDKLAYFQEVLGAELVEEQPKKSKSNSKQKKDKK